MTKRRKGNLKRYRKKGSTHYKMVELKQNVQEYDRNNQNESNVMRDNNKNKSNQLREEEKSAQNRRKIDKDKI